MSEQQPPSRAVEICSILARTIREGRLSLQIAVLFHDAMSTGRLLSNRWLYQGIRVACWRDTLMSLARLMDPDTRSITLTDLLNYSREHPEEYRLASPDAVRDEVEHQRGRLTAFTLQGTVRHLRNTTLAHTDRRHIDDPPSVQIDPIATAAVEEGFRLALSIVNALRHLLDGVDMGRTPIDADVRREFERLLGPHDAARAEQEARREEWRRAANLPDEGEEE